MDLQRLLEELKRRQVVRAAVAYAAALFIVLQVAEIVIPAVGLPATLMTGLVVVGVLGFPLVVALAWAVDLTPHGIAREVEPALRVPPDAEADAEARGGAMPSTRTATLLVAAVAVVAGSAWWALRSPESGTEPIRSLAVLPLQNLTGDEAQAHFVDGMHDILISELSHLDGLAVRPRTSVVRYRDSELSATQIAAQLGEVDALMEGSVFRQGDTVRISVSLVRVRPEDHVWDGVYEGRLSQALALQARIAEAVAGEIEIALSTRTADYLARRERTEVNPEAQEAYLRAMALWRTRDPERLVRAISYFEQAVAIDPEFALGWAGLANGYTVASGYEALDIDLSESVSIAEQAANRALALEPGLVEGRVALGANALYGRQDFASAERELSRALELAPSHAQAQDWLGDALLAQGRLDEALTRYRRAAELDPFSALMHRDYARALAMAGRCEEAVREADKALEIDPLHFFAYDILRNCALREGRTEDALAFSLDVAENAGGPQRVEDLRAAYEAGGIPAMLVTEARMLDADGLHVLAAVRLAMTGRVDESFETLDRALADRDALLILLRAEPAFEPLRSDPRWQDVIAGLEALAGGGAAG